MEKAQVAKIESGYVYLVKPIGHNIYKIGSTVDPDKRLRRMHYQTCVQYEYVACTFVQDYIQVESWLQSHFTKFSVCRDWFALSNEQTEQFDLLAHHFEASLLNARAKGLR